MRMLAWLSLAREVGPSGIRANSLVVAPGCDPAQVADAAVFLVSDLASTVTGQSLDVGR